MMNKIYVVNGLPLSGKTKFGEIVGEQLSESGINFLHTSSIDPVKALLRPLETWDTTLTINLPTLNNIKWMKETITGGVDWDGKTKDDFWRWAMSELKTKITKAYPELIHEFVLNKIATIPEPYVSFVDIREPENIQSFRDFCQHQRYKIETSAILVKSDGAKEFKNYSDLSVDSYRYDIVVENPRNIFASDEVALWILRCRAKTFVEQEILEGRTKERLY